LSESRVHLQRLWSEVSYRMQSLRDNPECAKEEYDQILDAMNPGITAKLTFDLSELDRIQISLPKPKVFIFSFNDQTLNITNIIPFFLKKK